MTMVEEQALIESILIEKDNLDLIFDFVSDGIFTHDQQMRITSFNTAAEKITGFNRAEAIGKRCPDIFAGPLCGTHCILHQAAKASRWIKDQELQIMDKNGRPRTIILNTAILHDKEKKPWGVVAIFRDMTELVSLKRQLKERFQFHKLIGKNHQMQEVYNLIEDIADSDATVLIQGESGTGKELVAQAIHYQGPRTNKPFVRVNCSTLAESLLESELFGHVRGAFTGAIRDKIGRFELAQGGTAFLDEIGDISPAIQVKLLRVLQEKEIERVGDTKSIKVDVRVIAATNHDLKRLMREGKFREDLFYRLYVIPIHLPPLRERKEDIPLLVEHFIRQFKGQTGKKIESISEEALKLLLDYSWPGNVRELENVIEHAFVKCRVPLILPEHLPQEILGAKKVFGARKRPRLTEEQLHQALQETRGNKARAARELGIGRTTLWRKLKKG